MRAAWFMLRADARAHRGIVAALIAVIVVAGGLAQAMVAGAGRTGAALDRQVIAARASDAVLFSRSPNRTNIPAFKVDDVRRLAPVASVQDLPYAYYRATIDGRAVVTFTDLSIHVGLDPQTGRTLDRLDIVDGRMSNPAAADELVVSQPDAIRLGIHVGSTFDIRFGAPSQQPWLSHAVNTPGRDPGSLPYKGPHLVLRVVGLYAGAGTLAMSFGNDRFYRPSLLTPAFQAKYGARTDEHRLMYVRLRDGAAGIPAFSAALDRLAPGGSTAFQQLGGVVDQLSRGTSVDAAALRALAALVVALGLVLGGQLFARRAAADQTVRSPLLAIGCTERQLGVVAATRAVAIGVLGATGAAILAVALSPLFPLGGLARQVDPSIGFHVDAGVLVPGAAGTIVAALVLGTWPAMLRPRRETNAGSGAARRPSLLGRLPLTLVLGLRFDPVVGRLRVLWRGVALLVLTGAIAGLAVLATWSTSFHHLAKTPTLYGQQWDTFVGGGGAGPVESTEPKLRADPRFAAFTEGSRSQVTIGGEVVGLLGMGPGPSTFTVISGRAPRQADEIAVGQRTLNDLHLHVGQVLPVAGMTATRRMRLVGTVVVPPLTDAIRLGHGAVTTIAGLRTVVPAAFVGYLFVRLHAGADLARDRAAFAGLYTKRSLPPQPIDLANTGRAEPAIIAAAVLFGLMVLSTLAAALAAAVRRNRDGLEILRVAGMSPIQTIAVLRWHALSRLAAAAIVGLPVGAIVGRLTWSRYAQAVGVVDAPQVPWAWIVVIAAGGGAVAVAVAQTIGWRAARSTAASATVAAAPEREPQLA